ncbi:MAG: hypothetical protein RR956_07905 [Christensenella sp.]
MAAVRFVEAGVLSGRMVVRTAGAAVVAARLSGRIISAPTKAWVSARNSI